MAAAGHGSGYAIRSIDDARLLHTVADNEFTALRTHRGDIVAVEGNVVFRVRRALAPRLRLALPGGLIGHGRLIEAVPSDPARADACMHSLPKGEVRLHFCAHSPCRGRFAGVEVEPPYAHLIALRLVEQDAAMDIRALWKGVAELGVLATCVHSAPPGARLTDAQTSRLRVGRQLGVVMQERRVQDAMVALSYQWRGLGAYVGLFAFFTYAFASGERVQVQLQPGEPVDVVERFGPWAIPPVHRLTRLRGERVALACIIEDVDASKHIRQLRAVSGGWNHYVPLVRLPEGACSALAGSDTCMAPAHPPCDGTVCGGVPGDACMALLCAQLAPSGWAPLRSRCEGNCAFDVMLSWEGGSRELPAIKALRNKLAEVIRDHSHETHWQHAFRESGENPPGMPLPFEGPPSDGPPVDDCPSSRSREDEAKDSRLIQLQAAMTWKIGVKKAPAYLIRMALGALSSTEDEDALLLEYERRSPETSPSPGKAIVVRRRRNRAGRLRERLRDGRAICEFLRARGIDPCHKLPPGTWNKWCCFSDRSHRTQQEQRRADVFLASVASTFAVRGSAPGLRGATRQMPSERHAGETAQGL